MFASNMKILTLNTNSNIPTAQGGGGTQPVIKDLNNSGNEGSSNGGSGVSGTSGFNHKLNKREQKHNTKTKFIHGNNSKMQQHITQHQQLQKYHHNNNSNTNNKLKKQHYNNSNNNNSTSSLNRKKYYQQQHYQHQQQQQYLTTIQQPISTTPITATVTNNNSNTVKNQNYTNIDLLIQQQQQQQQQQHQNIANTAINLPNHNANSLETCTCLYQQNNCEKLSLSSCSSGSSSSATAATTGDYNRQQPQLRSICYDSVSSAVNSSSSKTSLSISSQTTASTSTAACISCWPNFTKLSQQQPQSLTSKSFRSTNTSTNLQEFVASAVVASAAVVKNCDVNQNLTRITSSSSSSSTSSTTVSTSCSGGQLQISSNTTSSSTSKKKSNWKNSNTSGSGAGNCSLSSSGYSSSSANLSPKLNKEKLNVSDKNLLTNMSKNSTKNSNNTINNNSNVQKYSTTLAANNNTTQQKQTSKARAQGADKLAMNISLTGSSGGSTSNKNSTANISNTSSSNSKTSTTFPITRQADSIDKQDGAKQMLKSHDNISSNSDTIKTTSLCTSTISAATTSSSSSVPSSPNSYTLDFLHSVGVKMTGVTLRSSGMQGLPNAYGNQSSSTNSPVKYTYPYTAMTTNQRQPRYMYGSSNTNNSGSSNQQQHHYYHHHQPSQLTIASFLQKDLLGGDNILSNAKSTSCNGGVTSGNRNTNNYNDEQQQQRYTQQPANTRYHHNYFAGPYQQQQSQIIQPTNYGGGGGGYGGELARLVTNGSGGGQRNSCYASYTNYQNPAGEAGRAVKNNLTLQQSRQLPNNVGSFSNTINNSQANKKNSYASSTTSSGSSSSSKSISSNTSNISSRQLQTVAGQEPSTTSSNLNLAIETLPTKNVGFGNQRGNHRGYHHNHHGHHHHHGHHYGHHHQHAMMNSPNMLQHQNYYNLTYVTTDGSAGVGTSRGCSPVSQSLPPTPLSATNCNSPKTLESSPGPVTMLMNFNASHLQYQRYANSQQQLAAQQQFHQFQQQQHQTFLNKKLLDPLTLNMPSPSPSPTPSTHDATISLNTTQPPPPPHNIISCSQLDEATTAAAAAAATSSSTSGIIAGNDYDSDCSSNHSSTKNKYHSLKSLKSSFLSSSSSSSSASTTSLSLMGPQVKQNCSQTSTPATCGPTTPLHSPLDYNYSTTTTHAFPNLQVVQQLSQQHSYRPTNETSQLPQIYANNSGAVISLLNLPTKSPNSYADEDYQQQQTQHQFFFNTNAGQTTNDHLNNMASAFTAVATRSNASSGYWSPSHHNNQFLYHQTSSQQVALMPPTTSSSSSCGSSSASISPRLDSDDIQQQTQKQLHNHSCITNSSLLPSPCTSCLNEQFSNIIIENNANVDSGMLAGSTCSSNSSPVSSCSNNGSTISINSANGGYTYKAGSSQLLAQQQQRLIAQQTYQSSSSSTSSLSSSSASTLTSAVRGRGAGSIGINTNNGRNNQFPPLSQSSLTTSVSNSNGGIGAGPQQLLPPPPTQHLYSHQQQQQQSLPPPLPPHNLLYNNPQTHHIRALSTSSVHDFFTHTPPDRFLARAHLIEAKEAPATLLNNSKWDTLSQDIWKKFINSQQTEETFKQKMRLWRYLYLFIKNAYPRYGLYLVGSTISGFGSDSSDVDMCLVSRSASSIDPRMEALFNLTVLRDCLSKSGEFETFNLIEAKVPILRFRDRIHQLEVDLNFNNCVGIKNTHLLYCYSQLDWRLRPLVLVTKLWAQYHNINNAKNMTISSYSLVLMVIHFLQYAVNPPVLPCLHEIFPDKFPLLRSNDFGYVDMNETIGSYENKNTQTIGELFLYFLEYYSCFDYTQFAISVRTGGLLPINVCRTAKSIKNDIHQWKELCIEEPFDLTNTARSVYDYETFERVKAVFVASWRVLQETLDLNSVFSTTLIPSPCLTGSITMFQNTNSTINKPVEFSKIETDVNAVPEDTKINLELYTANDFRDTTTSCENYKVKNNASVESEEQDGVIDVDGDDDNGEGDNNGNITATNSTVVTSTTNIEKHSKHKDLNRTLTPRQIRGYSEKEFSPSSSMTCIKTSTKNVSRNNSNNNKAATPIIS